MSFLLSSFLGEPGEDIEVVRAVSRIRGIELGRHAVLLHRRVQVAHFFQCVAKTVVSVCIRRVMPDGFQHLDSCPLPVLAQQERDSQLTVQVGILSVEFERRPQTFNGLIQPALEPAVALPAEPTGATES